MLSIEGGGAARLDEWAAAEAKNNKLTAVVLPVISYRPKVYVDPTGKKENIHRDLQ